MNCLMVDIGSTFIKYGVYNETECNFEMQSKLPFPAPCFSNEETFLVSSQKIKENVLNIFDKVSKYHCKKVYFSVQMHGYILKADGTFSDYVSWRDKSGDITDEKVKDIDFNKMGTSLKKNLPLVKILNKGLCGEFFTLGSYVSYVLTGENATHISDACASGFFYLNDGNQNEYAENLIMPQVCKDVSRIGNYNGAEIYTPVGDHQASFLGSGANTDKYLLNIGTATQISCVHDKNFPDGEYEKRPFFEENLLYTISGLVGGDRLYKGEGKNDLLNQTVEAIKKMPKKNKVLFAGGGAETVFKFFKNSLSDLGIECSLAENNVGMRGLEMIANKKKVKSGTMLSEIRFANFPIIAKNSGLDFVILDNEHGSFDYSDISAIIVTSKLIGMDVIVRIGDSSRAHITKLADIGVSAFLLPMTNCSEDIKQVVDYAKYVPVGKRGVSTTRAHTLYNPPKLLDYMKEANEKMKIYAQIETVKGIQNIESILETEGVDGIFIGPNDLSVDMNSVSDKKTVCDAIEIIAKAANSADKSFGIITSDRELIDFSLQNNARMISVGSELNMMINGCKKIIETVHKL